MADLDDLVLIEVDDYLPSSHLSSRTASPTMSDVGCHHPLNSEEDQFYQALDNSGEPTHTEPSSISPPHQAESFVPSPPPPPPSSHSLGPTPPNGELAASSAGVDVGIPFPIIGVHEDRFKEDGKSSKDSVAGLQSCQPKSKSPPKGYNFPVTLHNGRAFNPNRRRRCAFNDAPPPLPPPTLPTDSWPKYPEGRPRSRGMSPILPPVCGMPKDIFNLPPPPSFSRKPSDSSFNVDQSSTLPCPPPPPPPLPPPPFCGGPGLNSFPCPPPPPPQFVPLSTVFSSLDLKFRRYEPSIEHTVKFPTFTKKSKLPPRLGSLLHHRASPFDLHNWLWLLKYGEQERWYARPAEAELARLRRFEAKGLGSELVDLVAQGDGEEPAPSTAAPVVKVWVGEVMGASPEGENPWTGMPYREPTTPAEERRLENEFLVYYSVVEAPSQPDDADSVRDDDEDDDVRHVSRNAFDGCEALAGGRKVYKVERTGSADACLARAWHNAVFNGWSTVFSCVLSGDVDFVQADQQGLGVNAFERVSCGAKLLERNPRGPRKKTKIFY
ncbi:hypothetical protein HDK64DRAFT_259698 [Phyllosticta capitalensis]